MVGSIEYNKNINPTGAINILVVGSPLVLEATYEYCNTIYGY